MEKQHTYHLNIIDGNVLIPESIDVEYDSFEYAYDILAGFVHEFDGVTQVDGRVCDEKGEDIAYVSSIMN